MKIPQELKREELPLADALHRIGLSSSVSRSDVDMLIARLPDVLKSAPAFLCVLDDQWRYEFGAPYTVQTSQVLGTDQCPEVRILLHGLLKVLRHARGDDLDKYLSRLSDQSKHFDHLAELAPVLRAKELNRLRYEPRPGGENSPGPDWAMGFMDGASGLVEVKSRIKELLDLFSSLRSGTDPSPHATRMPVLPGLLKDVSRKFPIKAETTNSFQGVWVYSPVWFILEELQQVFDRCDSSRVSFLVVERAWREHEALTVDDESRCVLSKYFSLPGV